MKVYLRDSVVLEHSFFGEGPEAFKTIHMDAAVDKLFGVIQGNRSADKRQRLVAFERVGVKDAALFRLVLDCLQNAGGFGCLQGGGKHLSISLQDSQGHSLAGGPSTSLVFALSAQIGGRLFQSHQKVF